MLLENDMATVSREALNLWQFGRQKVVDAVEDLGDLFVFALRIVSGLRRRSSYNTLIPICYSIGVQSIPVVMITGAFIGMVLAVQAYSEFAHLGLATRLGQIINISVVRELGPVLAAVMLAGRVGSAMSAELATMRITEQIDALACLGTNPVHYLGSPRFFACVLLIPLLTILANFMGVLGGALICIDVYHVESHYYWENTRGFVEMWDLMTGLIKPTFFGAAIAVICCHRGFYSEAGAEGVGRAATRAFVLSFIVVLVLDFFLALFLNNLYDYLWPQTGHML
jgi:phospholipid/cholesterol/gamma-HCH transport system permease protein